MFYKSTSFYNFFLRRIRKWIRYAEEIRHASNYSDFYIPTKNETEEQITLAEEFIGMVEEYCLQKMDGR